MLQRDFTGCALRLDNSYYAVYSIFLVETVQTALSGVDLYYWFVSGFGNIDHLTSPYLSAFNAPIIGSVVSLTVQLFFVYRIWVLSGRTSWVLCLIICLVSLSYQSPTATLLPTSQCSAIVAVTSFSAGVYVRFLCTKLFPIWLTSVDPRSQQVRS